MKKIGLLCLALVLALGTLGVGYAMWFEDLYIEGTVNTGELDANWSIVNFGDSEAADKNVSSVSATMSPDGLTLYVTVTGGYPCIDYYVNFDVDNTGTIPFHICPLDCTGTVDFPGTLTITQPTPFQVHPNEHALGTISIHLDNTALENTTYNFACTMKAVQYNEACPTPTPDS